MKKLLLTLIIALGAVCGVSAVDLHAIQVDVTMNPSNYRALLERFLNGDNTLTQDQMSTVYYGYSFTPDYDPRETYERVSKAYLDKDYERTLSLAQLAMMANPVSLELNIDALAAAEKLKDTDNQVLAAHLGSRCDLIANTILESGRGTSADNPFQVINSTDIDRLMHNIFGVDKIIGKTTVGEIIAVKFTFPGNDRQHILYFDNSRERQFLKDNPATDPGK